MGTLYRSLPSWATPRLDLSGCVLYAPLWRPDLAGSSFTTEPPVPHVATVTGAVWGNQGRTFTAASQHMIACGNPVPLRITGAMTVLQWFNPGAVHGANLASKWNGTGNQRSWETQVNADGKVYASVTSDGALGTRTTATGVAYSASAWNFVAFVYDGSNILL